MIIVFCSKHPKYKGIRLPRCQCKACLDLYNLRNLLSGAPRIPFDSPSRFLKAK